MNMLDAAQHACNLYMYMDMFNTAQHACNLYVYGYVQYGTTCVQSIDNYELRMLDRHNMDMDMNMNMYGYPSTCALDGCNKLNMGMNMGMCTR